MKRRSPVISYNKYWVLLQNLLEFVLSGLHTELTVNPLNFCTQDAPGSILVLGTVYCSRPCNVRKDDNRCSWLMIENQSYMQSKYSKWQYSAVWHVGGANLYMAGWKYTGFKIRFLKGETSDFFLSNPQNADTLDGSHKTEAPSQLISLQWCKMEAEVVQRVLT